MSKGKSLSIQPTERDENGNKLYDLVIIHPDFNIRKKVVLEAKEKGLFAFPIHSLDALEEFLSGKNYTKSKSSEPRRARKYIIVPDSYALLIRLDKKDRTQPSQFTSVIRGYHQNARIDFYN